MRRKLAWIGLYFCAVGQTIKSVAILQENLKREGLTEKDEVKFLKSLVRNDDFQNAFYWNTRNHRILPSFIKT